MPPPSKSMAMTPDFANRLASVNGVVVPSKVPAGNEAQGKRSRKHHRTHQKSKLLCVICGSYCWDKRGLREHFVTCVGRNGNPQGARWDDPLRRPAGSVVGLRGGNSGGSLGVEVEDSPPPSDRDRLDNADPVMTGVEGFLSDSFETRQPDATFPFRDGWQQYRPDLQQIDPHLASQRLDPTHLHNHHNPNPQLPYWSSFGAEQHDPCPELSTSTNRTLLSMVQDWQDVINHEGSQNVLDHPQFLELMDELVRRCVISGDWRWNVNVENLDMGFSRVVGEGWR